MKAGPLTLACLAWGLRAGSVALAVLIPALVWPHTAPWLAASATGVGVGTCQGLLLLVGRARKLRAVGLASQALCAALQDRIDQDLAAVLGAVSSPSSPGSPQLAEAISRRIGNISDQLRHLGGGGGRGSPVVDRALKPSASPLALKGQPSRGTTCELDLQAAATGPVATPPPKRPPGAGSGGETILLVEDEDAVRELTALLLETQGYRVLQAGSAEEALRLAGTRREKLDLLLTDLVLPGMSGRELAEALRSRGPGLKVLFQSGYTGEMMVRGGTVRGGMAFLQKPFTLKTLSSKIREVLEGRER